MPELLQLINLLITYGNILIACKDLVRIRSLITSQNESQLLCLARSKLQCSMKSTTAVLVVVENAITLTTLYSNRIAIIVIHTDEGFLITIVRSNLLSCHTEETFLAVASVRTLVPVQIDLLQNLVAKEYCVRCTQRILQVYLILIVIIIIRKLCITKYRNLTRLVRCVRHLTSPNLIYLSERHIVICLCLNARILREHCSISSSMMNLALILIQVLANRLPGSRPEISSLIVSDVNVTSRCIITVEMITQDTAIGTALNKAVTTRIVGNDRTILRRTKIVTPRSRCIRSGDHIFAVLLIKVTIIHENILLFLLTVFTIFSYYHYTTPPQKYQQHNKHFLTVF